MTSAIPSSRLFREATLLQFSDFIETIGLATSLETAYETQGTHPQATLNECLARLITNLQNHAREEQELEAVSLLRSCLARIADAIEAKKIPNFSYRSNETLYASEIIDVIRIKLSELYPAINEEDPISYQPVSEIPAASLVKLSSGHHYELSSLTGLFTTAPMRDEEYLYLLEDRTLAMASTANRMNGEEIADCTLIRNPITRNVLSARELIAIVVMAKQHNIELVEMLCLHQSPFMLMAGPQHWGPIQDRINSGKIQQHPFLLKSEYADIYHHYLQQNPYAPLETLPSIYNLDKNLSTRRIQKIKWDIMRQRAPTNIHQLVRNHQLNSEEISKMDRPTMQRLENYFSTKKEVTRWLQSKNIIASIIEQYTSSISTVTNLNQNIQLPLLNECIRHGILDNKYLFTLNETQRQGLQKNYKFLQESLSFTLMENLLKTQRTLLSIDQSIRYSAQEQLLQKQAVWEETWETLLQDLQDLYTVQFELPIDKLIQMKSHIESLIQAQSDPNVTLQAILPILNSEAFFQLLNHILYKIAKSYSTDALLTPQQSIYPTEDLNALCQEDIFNLTDKTGISLRHLRINLELPRCLESIAATMLSYPQANLVKEKIFELNTVLRFSQAFHDRLKTLEARYNNLCETSKDFSNYVTQVFFKSFWDFLAAVFVRPPLMPPYPDQAIITVLYQENICDNLFNLITNPSRRKLWRSIKPQEALHTSYRQQLGRAARNIAFPIYQISDPQCVPPAAGSHPASLFYQAPPAAGSRPVPSYPMHPEERPRVPYPSTQRHSTYPKPVFFQSVHPKPRLDHSPDFAYPFGIRSNQ